MIKRNIKIIIILAVCLLLLLMIGGCTTSEGGDSDSIIWGRALSVGTPQAVANLRFSLDGLNIFGATDETGFFKLEAPIPAGNYEARFTLHGELISKLVFGLTDQQALDGATIKLEWPDPVTGNGLISGVVTNTSGAPLPGAEVAVARPDENVQIAYTDEFGAYSFKNLLTAGGYKVIASIEGYQTQSIAFVLNPDAPDRVNFKLQSVEPPALPHGSVTGHVTDGNGVDLPGVYVTVYPLNSQAPLYDTTGETTTGLVGGFELNNIIEGPYILWVGKAGFGVKANEIYVTAGIAWEGEIVLDGKYLIEH